MELRDLLTVLRRRWTTILIITLVVSAASAGLTLTLTPKYTASTRLIFAVSGGESMTDLAQGSNFAENQMATYAEVASSPLVLKPVIGKLSLHTTPGALAHEVLATVPTNTLILEVSVTDPSATQAARIANAIGSEVVSTAIRLAPDQQNGSKSVKATVLAAATVPAAPSSPRTTRNLLIGFALGLMLGVGVALLRHALDTKIRTEADLRAITSSPVLATIAFDDQVPNHPMMVVDAPLSAPSEAVRRLRTNFQFIGVAEGANSVVLASSVPGEGKTTTAVNLAVSLADAGSKVLLVDADLRRPSVAEYTGLEGRAGLTTVLIGRANLEDVIQPWGDTGLDILPSGRVPPNPSELLGSPAMSELLDRVSKSYDMVLLDSPPLLPVADGVILTKMAGGALVIVGADRIHRPQLTEALDSLKLAGGRVFGLVMNKIARRDVKPYSYERGYAPDEVPAARRAEDEGIGADGVADNAPDERPAAVRDWRWEDASSRS